MRKPKGLGWRLVQGLWAINDTVLPLHLLFPSFMFPTSIPTKSKLLTAVDLCSAFFWMPVVEANQCFSFVWEEKQFTWAVRPQGFTGSPSYFSQILKADLDDLKFPRSPTWLPFGDIASLLSIWSFTWWSFPIKGKFFLPNSRGAGRPYGQNFLPFVTNSSPSKAILCTPPPPIILLNSLCLQGLDLFVCFLIFIYLFGCTES